MVELQPSKLIMRVRFPSPAPWPEVGKCMVAPLAVVKVLAGNACEQAHIAQSVEHSLGKGEVTGSNPVMGTRKF